MSTSQAPTPTVERRALTIAGFLTAYSIGRTKANELMNAGVLVTRNVGRRVLVDVDSAERWYASLPSNQGGVAS